MSDFPHPHAQRQSRIFMAPVAIRPAVQARQPAGSPLAHLVAVLNVLDQLLAPRGL